MKKLLIGIGCAITLLSSSMSLQAAPNTPTNAPASKNINVAYYNGQCHWVGGYWHHGRWVGARKVCYGYGNHHCKWVGGYWRHGHWYPKQKVCW